MSFLLSSLKLGDFYKYCINFGLQNFRQTKFESPVLEINFSYFLENRQMNL